MSGLLRLLCRSRSWPVPRKPERIAPAERRWLRELSDEQLVDVVRGQVQVERAVDQFRKPKKGKAA